MDYRNFIVGGGATSMTGFCLQPFDVIKTLILFQHKVNSISGCLSYVHNKFGLTGFWKGYSASFLRGLFGGGILFGFLEYFRSTIKLDQRLWYMKFCNDALTGCLARSISVIFQCPLSVIKVQMENPAQEKKNLINSIQDVYKIGGFGGFFKGLIPNLLRDVPYTAFAIAFYELYAKILGEIFHTDKNNSGLNFISGGIGGFTACLVTQPFDVIKNRAMSGYKFPGYEKYPGIIKGMKVIYEHEGLRGFTKGISIRAVERSLGQALIWTFYMKMKILVHGSHK